MTSRGIAARLSRWFGPLRAWVLVAAMAGVAAAAPRAVVVEPALVQRGEVEPGEVLQFTWTLRNDGDAPLLIEALTPTCYCTAGKADANEVPPGGTTTIRVSVDPSDFSGNIDKGVEIATNDPRTPTQLVHVAMTVRPGIAIVPPELDFGVVPAAGSKELPVALKVPKERPLQVKAVTPGAPFLAVEQEQLQTDDRTGVRLYVKVKPGAPAGAFTTNVVVETNDPARPRIEIPVRGKGAGGPSYEPERLVFTAAAPGEAVGAITVRGGKGLHVTGVKSTSAALEAAAQPQPDGSIVVRVTVAKSAKPGRVTARLLIGTSDAQLPELAVPVLGVVK